MTAPRRRLIQPPRPAAVRASFPWLGVCETLTPVQTSQAAVACGAEAVFPARKSANAAQAADREGAAV